MLLLRQNLQAKIFLKGVSRQFYPLKVCVCDFSLLIMMSNGSPPSSDADDSGNCSPLNVDDLDFDLIRSDDLLTLNSFDESLWSSLPYPPTESQLRSDQSCSDLFVQTIVDSPDSGYSSALSAGAFYNTTTDTAQCRDEVAEGYPGSVHQPSPTIPTQLNQQGTPFYLHHISSLSQKQPQPNCIPLPMPHAPINPLNLPVLQLKTDNSSGNYMLSDLNQKRSNVHLVPVKSTPRSNSNSKSLVKIQPCQHPHSANERVYSQEELRKMRNREHARNSKEKQKKMHKLSIEALQNSLEEKENLIQSLKKQISEKDSLISLLQKQNNDTMLSLAQLQVKYTQLEESMCNQFVQRACSENKSLSFSANDSNIALSISKRPSDVHLKKIVSTLPAKRTCLFAFLFIFLFNCGFYENNPPIPQFTETGITSRRLLEVDEGYQSTDKSSPESGGYIYDPRLLFRRNGETQDVTSYDRLADSQLNSTRYPGCRDHMHSNSTHSYKITRDLTEAIKHHKKFNDKNSKFIHVDPAMKLQQMLYNSPNGALMKSIYDLLRSWERKDDTVYMFAFGSNEWFLPETNGTLNGTTRTVARPKMSLLMPALNNSVDVGRNSRAQNSQGLYSSEFANSDLGLYLMQIDCIVMDTHFLPYEKSGSRSNKRAFKNKNIKNRTYAGREP